MKQLSRILTAILYLTTAVLVVVAIGSAISKKPLLITAVRSNSMYPLFEKGDMLVIKRVSSEPLKIRDIVVFKAEEGSLSSKGWISHRIVGGNAQQGFITKGDANEFTDQYTSSTGPIKQNWISNTAVTINGKPLKIPLLGNLPLWMERYQKNPIFFPVLMVVLAAGIIASEVRGSKKKRHKKGTKLNLALVYVFSGLTISIMFAATTLLGGQQLTVPYAVSKSSDGAMSGSDVGIVKLGETVERPLSKISNKGHVPVFAIITTKDPQIQLSHQQFTLWPGEEVQAKVKVTGKATGDYKSNIVISVFYPLLPPSVLLFLSRISPWLALAVISLIPGLPLMAYPLFQPRLRKGLVKNLRHNFGGIIRTLIV